MRQQMALNEGKLDGKHGEEGKQSGGTEKLMCLCTQNLTWQSIRPCFACVQTGEVDLKVSAEALRTDVLCGNEVAVVPKMGRIDTVIRTLRVEVSNHPSTQKKWKLLFLDVHC